MTEDFYADSVKKFAYLFQEKVKEEFNNLQKPNILIIGQTGVGKSSLINAIFGKDVAKVGSGKPVTDSHNFYSKPDVLVNIYDSAGWEGGSVGEEKFFKDTKNFLSKNNTTNIQDHIHIVWYLIDASSARFTDFDTKILKYALNNVPILVILSKGDIATDKQIDSLKDVIRQKRISNLIDTIAVAADPLNRGGRPICEPYGLKEVVDRTLYILPELFQRAFISAQMVSLSEKDKEAKKAIANFSTAAFGIGFVPIPMSDAPLLFATQAALVARISIIYGFKPTQTVISAIGGITAGTFIGYVGIEIANFLKFLPGVGTLVGGIIDGAIASAFTAALGFSFSALFHLITKSIIKGENVTYTKEFMDNFLREKFQQNLRGLQLRNGIEGYEPEDGENP